MVARVERKGLGRKFDYKEHDVIFGGGENVLYLDCDDGYKIMHLPKFTKFL